MKVHFIAIGGSAMHNLALALHEKGYQVTGSDDEVLDPSRTRLMIAGILPKAEGWFPEKITSDLDAIILGMHAHSDNPELAKAKELNLKIYSYPEYIYEQTKDKTRVVIGGSHGKTTITAMILHVLQKLEIECDYMVGAQLDGFTTMVKLSNSAKIAVIEGDEYLSSPIDRRPKFHLYKPTIGLISGIAWDHFNVFPTFEFYVEQFAIFANMCEKSLVYSVTDKQAVKISENLKNNILKIPYGIPKYTISEGVTSVQTKNGYIALEIFGQHNLNNMEGARNICNQLGVEDAEFYAAISSFKGASKRLEKVKITNQTAIYKDFAHSPSKLKATTSALKEQYPNRELIACMELHTYSSLNKEFIGQYKDSMESADKAYIYYSEHTLKMKRLPELSKDDVKFAFGKGNITVFNNSEELQNILLSTDWKNKNLLMMSSGNFDGIDFKAMADKLI
ncbi:MAG: UDP-N-acetylmuramate--L-alanine ligase [Flavobacteriales bacterium]